MIQALGGYLGPGRHYHNIGHVADCLRQLGEMDRVYGSEIRYREELIVAVIYHDCVYDPLAKNNEGLSADAAVAAYPNLDGEMLRSIVMATLHSGGPLKSIEEKIMADVDLAGLTVEFGEFQENTAKIRKEYSMVEDEAFRQGRCAFLEGMLKRPRIYYTDLYFERYEVKARENLRRSLEVLSRAVTPT